MRILDGETLLYRIAVEGVATCVVHVVESRDPFCKFLDASELLYGTENGVLGQILLDSVGAARICLGKFRRKRIHHNCPLGNRLHQRRNH